MHSETSVFTERDGESVIEHFNTGWPALLETPGTSWKLISLLEKPPGKSKKLEKLLELFFFHY